jgi:hypothetical protein
MHIDGEIKSNKMIKQSLEELENQIGAYPLNELIHSLREYLYEALHDPRKVDPTNGVRPMESFWRISFGCPWIIFIAISQKDSPKNSHLQKPDEKQFDKWSNMLKKIVDQLLTPAYGRRFLMNDFIAFPEKIKAWEIVDESRWKKDIAPFIPPPAHTRILNTHIQNNFVRNASFPIARSYILTKLFIDGLEKELQQKLTQHITDTFGCKNLESLHISLYQLSHIILEQKGVLAASKIHDYLTESKKQQVSVSDPKQLNQIVSEIEKLLKFLSTTADEISTKYSKVKNALFEQKTMLVNDNPFLDKPLYQEIHNEETHYICLDRILFNMRLETILIHFVDKWRENLPENEKNNAKYIGTSRESYLHKRIEYHKDLLVEGGIARLDEIEEAGRYLDFKPKDHGCSSFADFIVETSENIVIIECKNSFGIWRPFYEDKDKYYDSLDRIKKALDQCNKTHEKLKTERKTKRVFHIVLCNEKLWNEGAIVGLILHLGQKHNTSSDKVKKLLIKPGNYSILSIAAFDFLLYTKTLDKFISECRERAKPFDSPIKDNEAYDLIIAAENNLFNYHDAITDQSFEYSNMVLREINQKAFDPVP